MMKELICIKVIGLFLLTIFFTMPSSSMGVSEAVKETYEKNILPSTTFKDLSLEDDAFHSTDDIFHIETWYFDAVFSNEYSMAVIVSVVQKGRIGSVLTGLYIYKNGELIHRPRTFHPIGKLTVSEEKLDMKISDETTMSCDIDLGSWVYQLTEDFDDVSLNLQFVNMSPGWKTDITGGWWLVNPRLDVTGWIKIHDKKIPVTGEGYHDHNWFYLYTPFLQKGWHFGNIAGDNLGITWATVLKDTGLNEVIGVINQKQKHPINVDSKDITLSINKYMWCNRKKIPKEYSIVIQNDNIHVNLDIKTVSTNHVKLPMLNYWRIHSRITGAITVASETEKIDTIAISELMKFSRVYDPEENLVGESRLKLSLLIQQLFEKMHNPILKRLFSHILY